MGVSYWWYIYRYIWNYEIGGDKMRYQNYGLWIAVAALVLMVLQDVGIGISPERYQEYVDKVMYILVLLGIISNPKEGKWFGDKK